MSTLFDQLPDEAHARRADPVTSHEAAASIEDMRPRQRDVYQVVLLLGRPVTHEEIGAAHRGMRLPKQTPQSIRSRCAELVEAGWIVAHDRAGVTENGGRATRWITTSQRAEAS